MMPMPMMMCMMTCTMTKTGMTCEMMPMDDASMPRVVAMLLSLGV